jgi:hypothetical protein
LPYWRGLPHRELSREGLYRLWRVQRLDLQRWVAGLSAHQRIAPDWQRPRPERY